MSLALLNAAVASGVLCDANRSSSISWVTSLLSPDASSWKPLKGKFNAVLHMQMEIQACVGQNRCSKQEKKESVFMELFQIQISRKDNLAVQGIIVLFPFC